MPFSTHSPIECFAKAIQFVSLAAVIDERITELVPMVAECFVAVSNRPNARTLLKLDLSSEVAVKFPEGTDPRTVLLHKAIHVVSLCAAECPTEVSRLIPLVSGHMISMMQPSFFPSTIVEGETEASGMDHSDKSNMESTFETLDLSLSKKKETARRDERDLLPASSSPGTNEEGKQSKMSHQVSNTSKLPPSDIPVVNLLSPNSSPTKKSTDATYESVRTSESSSGRTKVSGKLSAVDDAADNASNASNSAESSLGMSSNLDDEPLKRSQRRSFDDNDVLVSGRIPKRVKINRSSAAPSNVSTKLLSYGIKSTLSFEVLLKRFKAWNNVLNYNPMKKCVPHETYLAIIVTNPAESDLLKAFKDEEGYNADVAQYLSITKVILIPRPGTGEVMGYCIANLHKYPHGTLHVGTEQDSNFKEATAHLEVQVLDRGMDFSDPQSGVHVSYKDPGYKYYRMPSLIDDIAPLMDTSCSSARKVPSISCGWSTANAHEYKNNRTNMVGSISPFLIAGGINNLDEIKKVQVVRSICNVIQSFSPCGRNPRPFFHSDINIRSERARLAEEFLKSLLGEKYASNYKEFFLAEGFSFILNNYVSFHTDRMNDPTSGMNDTLSINTTVKITAELAGIKSVAKAMELFHLEVGDPLLFSLMVYSRKCIRDHIKKQMKISSMKDTSLEGISTPKLLSSHLNWLISPLLNAIERVDSAVNSNAIWDNYSILEYFMNNKQGDSKNSQYRGKYVSIVAGFDKMRYWSPVKYLADALNAQGLVQMDGTTLMGFVCFAALETNGTFLLAGILDDAMCVQDPKNGPFKREVDMHGMYAALIFAAHRKNKTTGTGTVYGSSKVPRHQHHNRGSHDRFPIAGGKGLLSFTEGEKLKIATRCQLVVNELLELCAACMEDMKEFRQNKKRDDLDKIGIQLCEGVQEIAGSGVGHIFALNFLQVAAMFGFLPGELVTWACVNSKTSGAYKAINALYHEQVSAIIKKNGHSISRWKNDLAIDEAQTQFSAAVKWIQENVNYNFTHALAENILCELNREEGSIDKSEMWQPSKKQDVLYFFEHRKATLHHLYRWKSDVRGCVILQVLLMSPEGQCHDIKNLTYLSTGGKKGPDDTSVAAYWSDDPTGCKPVGKDSRYILSEGYRQYFM